MKNEELRPPANPVLGVPGAVLVAISLIVFFGRFSGFARFVTMVPGGVPMAFPTAVGFFLSGIAFLSYARNSRLARLVASLVLLLGAGTLLLYLTAQTFEIRQFYYDPKNPVISVGGGFDGRMSPNLAGAFAVLGCAMILLGARRPRLGWIVVCASLLLAVAALALISYLSGMNRAPAWWRYTGMAIPSSVAIMIAAIGLLAWVIRWVKLSPRSTVRTLPLFCAAATIALVLGAVMLLVNEHRRESAQLVTNALEIQTGIERFISSMARMETSTRNYLLSGDQRYVSRMQTYRRDVRAAVTALERLVADDPKQKNLVNGLSPLVDRKFASNDAQVNARRELGEAAAVQLLLGEPREILAGLRSITDQVAADAEQRLAHLKSEIATEEATVQIVLLGGSLITIGLVVLAFSLVTRAQEKLQQANEELENRVDTRTTELRTTASQLRESEQRLRFLADTMPQLVWTVRPDGSFEDLSRGWHTYLGVTSHAEVLAALDSVVHPEDRAASHAELQGMLREGRAAQGELRLRRVDGMYRWHLWRAHPEASLRTSGTKSRRTHRGVGGQQRTLSPGVRVCRHRHGAGCSRRSLASGEPVALRNNRIHRSGIAQKDIPRDYPPQRSRTRPL